MTVVSEHFASPAHKTPKPQNPKTPKPHSWAYWSLESLGINRCWNSNIQSLVVVDKFSLLESPIVQSGLNLMEGLIHVVQVPVDCSMLVSVKVWLSFPSSSIKESTVHSEASAVESLGFSTISSLDIIVELESSIFCSPVLSWQVGWIIVGFSGVSCPWLWLHIWSSIHDGRLAILLWDSV